MGSSMIDKAKVQIEREAFESWYAQAFGGELIGIYEDDDEPGSWIYLERDVASAWDVWQARAALDKAKDPTPSTDKEKQNG